MSKTPLALIILDGWGHRLEKKDNGIELAHKPFFDSLTKKYPHTLIDGSGPAVGLPVGVMGNSEVGHMNLGAGRVVFTGLSQIYQAIEDGSFFKNPALLQAANTVKKNGSTLHLMGLLSDGAVHSHQDHLYALLEFARLNGITSVAIHCFMDGRDTPPNDGVKYIKQLQEKIAELGVGRIASVCGRFYAMDRDKRWDRVEQAFGAICGEAKNTTDDVLSYLEVSYKKGEGDEFVKPVVVTSSNKPVAKLNKNDALVFFNFRADRAREISHAFVDLDFQGFDRRGQELPALFVCAAPYDSTLSVPVAFTPHLPQKTLPEILEKNQLTQLRIAETEKYAHVTFFFSGGRETVFQGEDRALIPSPREVATYDKKPEMSALLVKDELINRIKSEKYDVIICNFANTDMVGHTAIPTAIIKAVETVDECLREIIPHILAKGGTALVTADHGNAELMVDANGEPMTAHTTNLVPFIVVSEKYQHRKIRAGGRLCDVAPTMLEILGVEKPSEMTGESLLC